ncbi:hypothetical protein M9458_004231, partial [Cirrhinus mrigala]
MFGFTGTDSIQMENLSIYCSKNIADQRFRSTTSRTSTELIIGKADLSDSALYYCALRVA